MLQFLKKNKKNNPVNIKKATCYCQICYYVQLATFIRTQSLNITDQILPAGHKVLLDFIPASRISGRIHQGYLQTH